MSWKPSAFLALSIFGVGSLAYLFFKKRTKQICVNYDYYYCSSSLNGWRSSYSLHDYYLLYLQNYKKKTKTILIPKKSVGIVIGRNGSTIKEIERKANVTIIIRGEKSDEQKKCILNGTEKEIKYAESLIHEVIVSQPLIETYEMYIPLSIIGRLLGKKGKHINVISTSSNAKIKIETSATSPDAAERKLIIKGTAEEIALAKTLIEQKIEEAQNLLNQLEVSKRNRPLRNQHKYLLPGKSENEEVETHSHKEKFKAASSNGVLEVYVSVIENPDHIWVQMVGPLTIELDRLCEEMTDYYSKDENQKLHALSEVRIGQIVAAPFIFDNKLYRAEVIDIKSNYELDDPDVSLYYVDYGNSFQCKKSCLYELKTDFLKLKFQAIECMLARIEPRGSTWSEEVTEALIDLTHAGIWKSLSAKIHSYKPRPQKSSSREGSPMPCIDLFDASGEKTIDIAEELVERGFADWKEGESKFNHQS